jgi:hypothetical protein
MLVNLNREQTRALREILNRHDHASVQVTIAGSDHAVRCGYPAPSRIVNVENTTGNDVYVVDVFGHYPGAPPAASPPNDWNAVP